MKNILVCLVLLFALSCSETVVPEQRIFENIARCCKTGDIICEEAFKTIYTFIDITGFLVGSGQKDSIQFNTILSDTLWKIEIPDEVIHEYIYRRPYMSCCNMPKEIRYGKKSHKVRFTCRVPPGKPRQPNQLPQYGGLPAELVRIEIID